MDLKPIVLEAGLDPVARAKEKAPTVLALDAIAIEKAELSRKLAQLSELSLELTGLEQVTKKEVEAEERQTTKGLRRLRKLELAIRAGLKPRRLDNEVFCWRDANGFPRLGVFSLESDICQFSIDRYGSASKNAMPKWLAETPAYDDVFALLQKKRENDRTIITARFSGMLPDQARTTLVIAKVFFDPICILAEVQGWDLKHEVSPLRKDPLIVGFVDGLPYLLDAFDTTTLEEYAKAEFTG